MSAALAYPFDVPVTAEVVTITPAMAEQWLHHNTRNRNQKRSKIEQYARDMLAGRWQVTGEAIKFGTDGTLLDGQNRLYAVIRAGVAIRSLVIRGLNPASQEVMDSGAARSAADALSMRGMKDTMRLAAAGRLALCVEHDVPMNVGRFSNSEVQGWVIANPDIAETGRVTGPRWRSAPLTPSVLTYCAWRLARVNEGDAKDFFTGLIEGAGLPVNSPILALRRRLSGAYGSARKIALDEQVALMFRAWNAYRTNETLERLILPSRSGRINLPDPL